MIVAFWLLLALPLYVYVGFPLLVTLVGAWRRRVVMQQPMTPMISLIIAAYNEEEQIGTPRERSGA